MSEDFSFLNEKIKEKPFYKKKPVVLIMTTIGLAILFGVVSSVVFIKVCPWLEAHQERVQNIEIPKDITGETENPAEEPADSGEAQQPPIVVDSGISVEEYGILYAELCGLAKEVENSLVTVTAVRSDVDWFNVEYENRGQTFGMIIGDNGVELLILTKYGEIEEYDGINVTFVDDSVCGAVLKKYDKATGLAVLSVNLSDITEKTREKVAQARLGNSVRLGAGTPVLALGHADGSSSSVQIGMLTSVHKCQSIVDAEYTVFATDINRNAGADGVLVNLNGEVIGIIQDEHLTESMENVLVAYAISDIKSLIESLSNNRDITYLGVRGVSVTEEAQEKGVPEGVYVTEVDLDSPAMLSGIQSGDVIQNINGQKISNMKDLSAVLQRLSNKQDITLEGRRQTGSGYKKINYETTLSVLE